MKNRISFIRLHHSIYARHYWQVTVVRKQSKTKTYDLTNASLGRVNALQERDDLDFWLDLRPGGTCEVEVYSRLHKEMT